MDVRLAPRAVEGRGGLTADQRRVLDRMIRLMRKRSPALTQVPWGSSGSWYAVPCGEGLYMVAKRMSPEEIKTYELQGSEAILVARVVVGSLGEV